MRYFCSPIQLVTNMDYSIEIKGRSEVVVGSAGDHLPRLLPDKRVVVVSDTNIDRHYHSLVNRYDHVLIGLGEASKTLVTADAIYKKFISMGADRSTFVLAIGGGSRGMIWGQELDVTFEGQPLNEELLRKIHKNKTGALINAAVQMGVSAAGGTAEDAASLERYAFDLGLVFQIVDDVLDVISTPEELGKPIGSDQENGKVTFATIYGPQGALELAQRINDESCQALSQAYGDRAQFLIRLASQLVTRRK